MIKKKQEKWQTISSQEQHYLLLFDVQADLFLSPFAWNAGDINGWHDEAARQIMQEKQQVKDVERAEKKGR